MTGAAVYLVVAVGLFGSLYLAVKTVQSVRRVGLVRLVGAIGVLVTGVCAAFAKLFRNPSVGSGAVAQDGVEIEPTDHDEEHWQQMWAKVGAALSPEEYLCHPDPEVSAIAQANLDGD